jgi:hypothetical protein
VFDIDDYLTLYNGALGQTLKAADRPPGDRIVRRIMEKIADFDHGDPADYLLHQRDADPAAALSWDAGPVREADSRDQRDPASADVVRAELRTHAVFTGRASPRGTAIPASPLGE